MATQLLASANTAANSADIVVVAGTPATVFLKDAAGPDLASDAVIYIQVKDDAGEYFTIGQLTWQRQQNAMQLNGPATFRLSRPAQANAVGAVQG